MVSFEVKNAVLPFAVHGLVQGLNDGCAGCNSTRMMGVDILDEHCQ